MSLFLADVFIPDFGMGLDEAGEEIDALARGEVVDLEAVVAEPVDASLEGLAFADDDCLKTKLADKPGAIPAGSERGDHDEVAVGALAAGVAEGVGLTVGRGVVMLHAAIVSRAEEGSIAAEDGGSDGDASFGETGTGFVDGDGEHGVWIKREWHTGTGYSEFFSNTDLVGDFRSSWRELGQLSARRQLSRLYLQCRGWR